MLFNSWHKRSPRGATHFNHCLSITSSLFCDVCFVVDKAQWMIRTRWINFLHLMLAKSSTQVICWSLIEPIWILTALKNVKVPHDLIVHREIYLCFTVQRLKFVNNDISSCASDKRRSMDEWNIFSSDTKNRTLTQPRRNVACHASHVRRGGADGTWTRDLPRDRRTL